MRLVLAAAAVALTGGTAVRSIYLNGTDISSARSQELKGVDVVINEKGDVFIVAPHYQVNEEDTYVPLSKFVQGMGGPKHQPMQQAKPVPAAPLAVKAMPTEEVPPAAPVQPATTDGLVPKAGTPVPTTAEGGETVKVEAKAEAPVEK